MIGYADFSPIDEKMIREIRSWAIFLLVIGIIQIVASQSLSNTWGMLLILVGIASFYFRSTALFVIYGTTLAWAAISNLSSGSSGWGAFSILQVFFAFQTFRQFFRFRSAFSSLQPVGDDDSQDRPVRVDKAARPFPWLSLLFGLVSLVGLVTVFIGVVIFAGITGGVEPPSFISFTEGLVIDFAVLGFATGLAGLLSKFDYRLVSVAGMVMSALVLLIEIGLGLLL